MSKSAIEALTNPIHVLHIDQDNDELWAEQELLRQASFSLAERIPIQNAECADASSTEKCTYMEFVILTPDEARHIVKMLSDK